MASRLYKNTRDSFSPAALNVLDRCREGLSGTSDGVKILLNMENEAHLIGNGFFGDPEIFGRFLAAWISEHSPAASDRERRDSYCGACSAYHLLGSRIPAEVLPDNLVRYVSSRSALRVMIEKVLGEDAVMDFDADDLSLGDAFLRLELFWAPSAFRLEDEIGRGKRVFATFNSPAAPLSDDATEIAEALAHPIFVSSLSEENFLFRLSYSARDVHEHRIPTVADAGWFHFFEPAQDVEPNSAVPDTCFGWTRPFGPQRPQPELVHHNVSLRMVRKPPEFVGVVVR